VRQHRKQIELRRLPLPFLKQLSMYSAIFFNSTRRSSSEWTTASGERTLQIATSDQ
jgi:hypothetical protein